MKHYTGDLLFWYSGNKWDQTLVTGSQINRLPCITSDITHYLFYTSSFNNYLVHNISKCDQQFPNKHNHYNAEEILNLCSELCYEATVLKIFTDSKKHCTYGMCFSHRTQTNTHTHTHSQTTRTQNIQAHIKNNMESLSCCMEIYNWCYDEQLYAPKNDI